MKSCNKKKVKNLTISSLALVIVSTMASPAMAACDSNNASYFGLQQKSMDELKDPGWFEIGAGISVIRNAGQSQQNAVGNMLTLRAYPFSRWYSQLKSVTPAQLKSVEVKLKTLDVATKDAAASPSDPQKKVAETQAAADISQTMQNALNDFGNDYAFCEMTRTEQFVKRFSVFLGRSVGGIDSKAIDGDINAFGITFDISPQFALVWGRAYFTQATQNGVSGNSKSAPVLGVQINLNAFKAMRGLTGSL